jgi:hypothetical protein
VEEMERRGRRVGRGEEGVEYEVEKIVVGEEKLWRCRIRKVQWNRRESVV